MKLVLGDKAVPIFSALASHHRATKTKDVVLLNKVFAADGLFVGTDDTEQWSTQKYVKFLEDSESGWDMTAHAERSIYYVEENIAAFFEVVIHKKYGPMRGSGVIVRGEEGQWVIKHYILSFSVPNHVVDKTNILQLLAL